MPLTVKSVLTFVLGLVLVAVVAFGARRLVWARRAARVNRIADWHSGTAVGEVARQCLPQFEDAKNQYEMWLFVLGVASVLLGFLVRYGDW